MDFIIVYITHGTELAAKKIANYLLDKKLVACANTFPISSAYWWKAKIQSDKEWISIVKTVPELWEQLEAAVEAVHPYDVPCIMKIKAEANTAYVNWIRKEVAPALPSD